MELFFAMIAWIFGILSGLYFKISIVFFILLILLLYIFRKKNRYIKLLCSKKLIIVFILCYIIAYLQIIYLEKSFEEKYQFSEQEIQVVGTIIFNPSYKEYKTMYIVKVESINGDISYKNTKLLLNIKKEKEKKEYEYGNKISFIGTFEEPSAQRNEGGFDYKQYLKTKMIYGIVETKVSKVKLEKENNSNIILKLANIVANKIQEKSNELLDEESSSLLTGILIGNKENLKEEVKEAFRKSNLSHMLAVSGAHVSYVIMGIGFIITNLKVSKKTGKIITIMLLLFFMLITEGTASVTRACFMTIYMILASLCNRRVTIFSSISISMLLLMLINPYCIFDVGLQLSYGGTIGIVVLYPILNKGFKIRKEEVGIKKYLYKIKIRIREIILITLSANIILFPVILYHFNTLSLTFLVSNLLAAPIMGILVLLGFFTIIVSFIFNPFGKLLSIFLQILLKLFLQIATIIGNLPLSQIMLPTPRLELSVLYYIIIFLFIYYKKIKEKTKKRNFEKKIIEKVKKIKRKTIIILIVIITIINFIYHKIPSNTLKIYFIDVGQGDSTLIVTPNRNTILIDGGGSKEKEVFDVGESTLVPYLLDRGITKLDYILISHFDSDHVGGILTILEQLKVKKVIINKQGEDSENYEEFKNIIKKKKIKVIVVKKRR